MGHGDRASAWFLRPTPMAELRTRTFRRDRRRPRQRDRQHAVAGRRGPALRHRAGDVVARARGRNPGLCRARRARPPIPRGFRCAPGEAAHGRPWFMDAMEAREGDGVAWFRLEPRDHRRRRIRRCPSVLGPADWTHGIARPVQNVVADPNPNLTVQLFRRPARPMGRHSRRDQVAAGGRAREPEAACCSTSTARSAGSRCR